MTDRENTCAHAPLPEDDLRSVSGGAHYEDDKPPTLYRLTCENPACAGWHAINLTIDQVNHYRTFGCQQCHTAKFLLATEM